MQDAGHVFDPGSLTALKGFRKLPRAGDFCEVCSRQLAPEHPHLVDPRARRIACACEACAFLFEGATAGKYRRVPRDTFRLEGVYIDDADWGSLSIPIGLAFFLLSSNTNAVTAIYPSPGGAVETELPAGAWEGISRRHPRVEKMSSDVEALLVNRLNGGSRCYLAPIDRCYELTGLLRSHWTGFNGGDEAWSAVDRFFARLAEQAIPCGVPVNARPAI